MPNRTAVLAFGSLIWEPGILFHRLGTPAECLPCETPFQIEFARRSSSRGCAPTLVKVDGVGRSPARLLVFDRSLSEVEAALAAREGCAEKWIGECEVLGHESLPTCYTALEANIPSEGRIPTNLARWAIESIPLTLEGRDGVSYLRGCRAVGCVTALIDAYEHEVFRELGVSDWEGAEAEVKKRRPTSKRLKCD